MLEFLLLLPLVMVSILSMTFDVYVDELSNVNRGNYFHYNAFNPDRSVKEKVIYLNLLVTDSGRFDLMPEYIAATAERHLKCGCSCTNPKQDSYPDQVFNPSTSRHKYQQSQRADECLMSGKYWDAASSECICPPSSPQICSTGEFFHQQLCRCVEIDRYSQSGRPKPPV